MKYLALMAIVLSLLVFGCVQSPWTTEAGHFDKYTRFTAFTNNSVSDTYALNTVLTSHAYSYIYYGGAWNASAVANVSLQGSIDQVDWKELSSVQGYTNGTSFVVNSPVMYVRAVVSEWNATAGNASAAYLTVTYAGTG